MPGFHAFIQTTEAPVTRNADSIFSSLRKSETLRSVLDSGKNHVLIHASENLYPFLYVRHNLGFCLVDGAVYNLSRTEVTDRLNKIYRRLEAGDGVSKLAEDFITAADGDFVVVIRCDDRWIVFNDMYARMATYYYFSDTICIVSRELKSIVGIIKEVEIDRGSLVEYLALRYPLGNKTLFKSIYRMEPSELLRIEMNLQHLSYSVGKTCSISFDINDVYPDPVTAQRDLAASLQEGALARVLAAKDSGAGIVVDLSGGFDTRAVFGLLSGITSALEFVSIKLSTGDESAIARQLWEACGQPGKFTALEVDHTYSIPDADELLLENDGLVNYNTTLVCERDIRGLRNHLAQGEYFRFGGLGGEFIRHPTKIFSRSLQYGYRRGFYSQVVDRICRFTGYSVRSYFKEAKTYLARYPERTTEGMLRRWYYEYYNNFVGAAAEDRERTVIWTVHPLWQKDFLTKTFTRVPLEWTGYEFFTGFLKAIEPKLLDAPIYKRKINLHDSNDLRVYDLESVKQRAKEINNKKMVLLKDTLKAIGLPLRRLSTDSSQIVQSLKSMIGESSCAASLFDMKALYQHFEVNPGQRTFAQVITIVRYLDNLKTKKNIKISF